MHRRERIQGSRKGKRYTRRIISFFGLGSLFFILLLSGCAEQQQYGAVEPICVENIAKSQATEVVEDVLAKMHFTIEKSDAESGFIRTRPLAGAQFFEFWRSDNVGSENQLQSNLHSVRRIAELNIREQDNELLISCEVQVHRLSLPERQVSSSARAYGMFSESTPSLQKPSLNPEQRAGFAWIDLGKDDLLAAEILKRIEQEVDSKRATSDKI